MEISDSEIVSTRLERIAKLARSSPAMQIKTLAHHIDIVMMREVYRITRKDGATGIDGVTATQYRENLEKNRPLGIPTFEDKVLQRAVVMVLQSVYEQDFLDR